MKKLNDEKGAIAMLALITVLFIASFLISAYVIISNKVQTQKEVVSQTKDVYESGKSMAEIYNSYFDSENIIPIYTAEQLLKVGSAEKVNINGKIYDFLNTNAVTYILMEDIEFDSIALELESDWEPLGANQSFLANFDGNGHKITVTDLNGDEHIYSEKNNFGGNCILTFVITPDDSVLSLIVDEEAYQVPNGTVEDSTITYEIELPYGSNISYTVTKNLIIRQGIIDLLENTTVEVDFVNNNMATP